MDIEDFLVIRNFRLVGNGDFFLLEFFDVATVAIKPEEELPEFWLQVREEREKNSRMLLSLGDILEFSV
jgi:hypothetical protein